MWAGWEYFFDFDPFDSADANIDSDGDGSLNKCENKWNTNPKDPLSFLAKANYVINLSDASMSWWVLPTTADIGIRAFSSTAEGAIKECVFDPINTVRGQES